MNKIKNHVRTFCLILGLVLPGRFVGGAEPEVTKPAETPDKTRNVVESVLSGLELLIKGREKPKLIYSTTLNESISVTREKVSYSIAATFEVLQGEPDELVLEVRGEGEIRKVTGTDLQDWSIRQETNGVRTLVMRPRKPVKPAKLEMAITAEASTGFRTIETLGFTPAQPALFSGYIAVSSAAELEVQPGTTSGLIPLAASSLPEVMRAERKESDLLAFRFHGSAYSLPLNVTLADPEGRRVVLRDFKLEGSLNDSQASFILRAVARVKNPRGGTIGLLSGNVALTEVKRAEKWRMRFDQGRYLLVVDEAGDFPVELNFDATVIQENGWNRLDFRVAPSSLQPIVLRGLSADTQFEFAGAARPERTGSEYVSYLPPDGTVKLSWKEGRTEAEGKLFYAAEMLSQVSVGPGLMRQLALVEFKVMQGELNEVSLVLRGAGEVTRVQGPSVLAWAVESVPNSNDRRLRVRLNQPQKSEFGLQVQMQTPLGTFPQRADVMQLRPEAATRFAGHFRVVNEGAVRLEVVQASGLSQISPEQFPESDLTRALFPSLGGQRFAYRFSGMDFTLRVEADQILPELSVSEAVVYHHGENESAIDAEFELEIREAPLRELLIGVPRGYVVARLNASGLSDYFLREQGTNSELRLVYGQPVGGRQIVQLRLERNQSLGATNWVLPRLDVLQAKSVRGHVAVTADAGFRMTPDRTERLTEIATAFFPRKVPGIQSAFRLSESAWEATIRVERLPQSIQADVFHLFSIGEGVAYGSSVINYVVTGAPISVLRIELSPEYFNVEFTGKDVRNWQKTDGGYVVQLHTPVTGAYTLLAAYERPFRAQGETLAFTGARPLDSQSEQGHTLVISAYQFKVQTVEASPGLLPLEPGEVPAEYRLLFDAPILAAYRYTVRPFNLRLELSPLAQGDSLNQVVDRAALTTRISKEGQVLTDVRYFVKNRGNPNFRLAAPAGTQLWSASVNGAPVVPVTDAQANLIPLPQNADPNAVVTIDVKLASRSANARRVTVSAPVVNAPVMLAEWNIKPDTGQQLVYRRGSLTPSGGVKDISGFAQLARVFREGPTDRVLTLMTAMVVLLALGIGMVRWARGTENGMALDRGPIGARQFAGLVVGIAAMGVAVAALIGLVDIAGEHRAEGGVALDFLASVQQSGNSLTIEVDNVENEFSIGRAIGYAWPALIGLVAMAYGRLSGSGWLRGLGWLLGWSAGAWAALRWPNGAVGFFCVIMAFIVLHAILPAARMAARYRLKRAPGPAGESGPTPVVASLITLAVLNFGSASYGQEEQAQPAPSPAVNEAQIKRVAPAVPRAGLEPIAAGESRPGVRAETVTQEIRVEGKFVFATAKFRWQAMKGEILGVLFEPAVLTQATFPTNALRLIQTQEGTRRAQQLHAQEGGLFDFELRYQLPVTNRNSETGFKLPTQQGLINQVTVTLADLNVEVNADRAVSVQREFAGSNTVARLVLSPATETWIGWRPRSRDVKGERSIFYAELFQLYVPAAGVIEGVHQVGIRPAQGEVQELNFTVPNGSTITDVLDGTQAASAAEPAPVAQKTAASTNVSFWRFDPETRKLRVTLASPQSRPFSLWVRSQVATTPLPFEQSAGLLSVDQAATEIGLLAIGTGNEVQLEAVTAEGLTAINLDDFPAAVTQAIGEEIQGVTVRRAYRYSSAAPVVAIRASAVEADVRVETQETLSLGEDRTLLAVNATVEITRAGIFRLSFLLPANFDVESISGPALSHWTESSGANGRVMTLHLRGKTEGQQQFSVNLVGPGAKAAQGWAVPRFAFREASKQRGTLLVVPEQGMRLLVSARDGVTQLDPEKSGVRQKGVLGFRLLQAPWSLSLDIEQVDPWVHVTSLQHAIVTEAQLKVAANLQYQIENTGLKTFRLLLPTNAENVRLEGEQVADFMRRSVAVTNNLQEWEVKLHRRVIGRYLLKASYHTSIPDQASEIILRGLQAADVNSQRGYVSIQSGGRLQVRVDAAPGALQPTEWQSIPRSLLDTIQATSANLAYRLIESAFDLTLKLDRHDAAKLLPARVNNITLSSVVSDNGVMLTQARLEMVAGDSRLLQLALPVEARFWFAFVNQNAVWPWREVDRILIPLEQPSKQGEASVVEIFFSSQVGAAGKRDFDLALQAPKFDLPLENVTWNVYLNEKWRLKDWKGSLQLHSEDIVPRPEVNVETYLKSEATVQERKTREAEQMLVLGNNALQQGAPQQARRAFQAAFGLSTHDNAFNEDARVQLHNIKLQQAIVGLNVRLSNVAKDSAVPADKLLEAPARKEVFYTQQAANEIINRNSADQNAAFVRVAERLIQQQDAASSNPAAIRASIPEHGRRLTFKRAVALDSDLRLEIETAAVQAAGWRVRLGILLLTGAGLGVLGLAVPRRTAQAVSRLW